MMDSVILEIEDYDESHRRDTQIMALVHIQHKLTLLADKFLNEDLIFETCLLADFLEQSLKVSRAAYYSVIRDLTELEAKVISLGVSQPD